MELVDRRWSTTIAEHIASTPTANKLKHHFFISWMASEQPNFVWREGNVLHVEAERDGDAT